MNKSFALNLSLVSLGLASLGLSTSALADIQLIALGEISGHYEDLSQATAAPLENGEPGNRFGGIGSGLAYAGNNIFLALPDRGPNASAYNSLVDDTASYIDRYHSLRLTLAPSSEGQALPYTLTPILRETTLLASRAPLVYGTGVGLGNQADGSPMPSGAPALNQRNHTHYFTGRSDNFDPNQPSTNPMNARLDPEGIRVSNDGKSVFISDEYGPALYQFDRATGQRLRAYALPAKLAISNLSAQKDNEIGGNTLGRTTNKGMEGLAITPDGKTLVGIMQANLLQDKKKSLRIVTVDIASGATHEYAYKLTDGSGVSEILAINNHQFLVDERDGSGFADTPLLSDEASAAEVKKLFVIDLENAQDVSDKTGDLSAYAVPKTLFLDLVPALTAAGLDSYFIPSKIEGLAFGEDLTINGELMHTLYVVNDNDFLGSVADPLKSPGDSSRGLVTNPNVIYVFAFSDADLPGYKAQAFRSCAAKDKKDHDQKSHH